MLEYNISCCILKKSLLHTWACYVAFQSLHCCTVQPAMLHSSPFTVPWYSLVCCVPVPSLLHGTACYYAFQSFLCCMVQSAMLHYSCMVQPAIIHASRSVGYLTVFECHGTQPTVWHSACQLHYTHSQTCSLLKLLHFCQIPHQVLVSNVKLHIRYL